MHDVAVTLIAFAMHLADPLKDPRDKALERDWIDAAGVPTPEGMALHNALIEQTGTRSSFRNVA